MKMCVACDGGDCIEHGSPFAPKPKVDLNQIFASKPKKKWLWQFTSSLLKRQSKGVAKI